MLANAPTAPDPTILYRLQRIWSERILGAPWFAWLFSIGLHGLIFLGLCMAVFRGETQSKAFIVPEARLDQTIVDPTAQAMLPLRLSARAGIEPAQMTNPSLADLPKGTVRLDRATLAFPAGMERDAVLAAAGTMTDDAAAHGRWPESIVALTAEAAPGPARGGPTISFFGQPGNAHKVVYVADVSASLMYFTNDIADQMRQSVDALLPTQWFHIVLARPRAVAEFAPRRLVPAIRKYKNSAAAFIDTIRDVPKSGSADPVEAMKRAFAAKPEMIYFLTDGDYPADVQEKLEAELRQLNAGRQVKITVIGFEPAPTCAPLLQRIAREHGGHYRLVEAK